MLSLVMPSLSIRLHMIALHLLETLLIANGSDMKQARIVRVHAQLTRSQFVDGHPLCLTLGCNILLLLFDLTSVQVD